MGELGFQMGKNKFLAFGFMLLAIIALPALSMAEFYKYVDKNGNVFYVDDLGKVPEAYRSSVDTYQEKYDHLSADERVLKLEQERQSQQELEFQQQQQLQQELQAAREREEAEKKHQAEIEKQEQLKKYETKVIIDGNRILVPVTLGNTGIEINTLLLLDTGASQIVLYREIAERLNIVALKKGTAQVAGGSSIYSELGRINYFNVGPISMENADVLVINHQGPPLRHSGLLGMNFLSSVEYSIDFQNQVIRWNPPSQENN